MNDDQLELGEPDVIPQSFRDRLAIQRFVQFVDANKHRNHFDADICWSKDYKWGCGFVTGIPMGAVEEEGFDTLAEAVTAAVDRAEEIIETGKHD